MFDATAFERINGSVQNMILAFIGSAVLKWSDILAGRNKAEEARISTRVATDSTRVLIGPLMTNTATMNRMSKRFNTSCKGKDRLLRLCGKP